MRKLIIIIAIFISLCVASCTTTRYVEIPVENTKIEYVDKIKYDSIYLRDSIS